MLLLLSLSLSLSFQAHPELSMRSGTAFLQMEAAAADSARLSLHNSEVLGRVIAVNPFVSKRTKQGPPQQQEEGATAVATKV